MSTSAKPQFSTHTHTHTHTRVVFACLLSIFSFLITTLFRSETNEIDVLGDGTQCVEAKFTITTTETDSFQFNISAAGTFYVDCGNDGTLRDLSDDDMNGKIVRSGTGVEGYKCSYNDDNHTRTIRFGGVANGYGSNAAISFSILESNNEINVNNLNASNKTYRNDYITKKNKINYIDDIINLNISGINKNIFEDGNRNMNRNISAKYINKNKSKFIFNNSTIDSNNNINSGIIKNMRKQQINSYKNKKNKLMNHSTKVTKKKTMNDYYNIKYSNILKENTNINIPKTKRDYIGKDILKNNPNLFYQNMNIKPVSNMMSSTIYSKKKRREIYEKTDCYNMRFCFDGGFLYCGVCFRRCLRRTE